MSHYWSIPFSSGKIDSQRFFNWKIVQVLISFYVSAAAASTLLSDISNFDLQFYMDTGNSDDHQEQHV
jgi:hypothetical protein